MSTVAEKIINQLEQKRLTQSELAKRLGVSPQYVGQITKGTKIPTAEKLDKIESALGLQPGSLNLGSGMSDRRPRRPASLANMQGVEVAYLDTAIDALREARRVLHRMSPEEALRKAAGKQNTYRFDAITEGAIVQKLGSFNKRATIFTEECNIQGRREDAERSCYFVDPFDRSAPFADFLKVSKHKSVADLFDDDDYRLTGLSAPFGSITCVRESHITFNAMIDYASGEVYVACKAMLKHANVDQCPDAESLAAHGVDIHFEPSEGTDYACFVGAPGSDKRQDYEQHLRDLELGMRFPAEDLQVPGGPARILYLASDVTSDSYPQLAWILSNGEKICEWFGWLAYAVHSTQLAVFELYATKFSSRDNILLAPPPNYSIFSVPPSQGGCELKLDRILVLDRPVFYRSALAVTHIRSTEVIAYLRALTNSRELIFSS